MTKISTVPGLVGEEYGSFDDLLAVVPFDWSESFRFTRVDFIDPTEAADYAMDLEYLQGVACAVVKAA